MLPLYTQKSLDQLTWNEIQKLHKSLGLKATATTRSRRDYQLRIIAAQPQPAVEPEATVTPLTCEICPLARLIDGNRYCCGLTDAITRGHWEAKTDCYEAVAQQAPETETTEPVAEVETPIAPVSPTPLTAEENTDSPLSPDRIWTIDEIEQEIAQLKADVLAGCTSKSKKPRLMPKPRPSQEYLWPYKGVETITWQTPFKGEILGKKGERRPFFIENDTIYVVVQSRTSLFCAIEGRHQNYHHAVIRQAVNVGKSFDPVAFKQRADARGCPSPKYFTCWRKDAGGQSCNLGQLYQDSGGWWWAWSNQQRTEGKKFLTKALAQKYLEIEYAERPYKFTFAGV